MENNDGHVAIIASAIITVVAIAVLLAVAVSALQVIDNIGG